MTADVISVWVIAVNSVSYPGLYTGIISAGLAIVGTVADRMAGERGRSAWAVSQAGIIAIAGVVLVTAGLQFHRGIWRQTSVLPYLSVAFASAGDRVVLPTGAIAWMAEPHGEPLDTAILLFHGAHPAGSFRHRLH